MRDEKACRTCGSVKPIDEYYPHPMMADGHLNICKECTKERVRRHRMENDHVREQERRRHADGRKRAQAQRWRRENAERLRVASRAHAAVARALKGGVLVRAETCEMCGAAAFCEAAHSDYSRPLDVRWLCRRCHRAWDQAAPKTKSGAAA